MVIVAGMGGGGSFPKTISWQEKQAWSYLTGNRPNRWELATLTDMDSAWLSGYSGKGSGKQHQGLGDYCGGKEIEKCRGIFGKQLERVCSTCPE